jgi:hypothetical protein
VEGGGKRVDKKCRVMALVGRLFFERGERICDSWVRRVCKMCAR